MKKLLFVAFGDFNQPICEDNSPSTVGENYTKKEVHIKMRDGYRFTPLSTRQRPL
jgi:hypothetical protein